MAQTRERKGDRGSSERIEGELSENIVKIKGWTIAVREFWWALATDQFLHHLTYLAIAAVIVGMA